MALVTAAAVVAGTTAAGLYLDAKFHIKKDLRILYSLKRSASLLAKATEEKRQCLYYLFEASVEVRGNNDCIWSREGCYTWNQTYEKANQYGHWFLSQGVKPHDYVAFYLHNSPDFMFAWLGLWSIGAAPAMINYNLSGNALLHCVKLCGAKLMLVDTDPEFQERIEGVASKLDEEFGMTRVVLDGNFRASIATMNSTRPDDLYREGVQSNWPMSMFYTSGTTGMPKGCPFTIARGYQVGCVRGSTQKLTLDDDRWFNCMPMYHGTGGAAAVTQMMTGTTLCIGKKFSTSNFWDEARDSKATWITYVGETARYLLAAPPSPRDRDHNVRAMHGNGLRPDVWTKFRDRFGIQEILEFFNSSEGVFGLATYAKGDFLVGSVGHHGAIVRNLTKNIYVPVKIDDESGAIVRDPTTGFAIRQPYSIGGEIIVSVPNEAAFAGYFNNPEATAKKFERDVFQKGDLWYRSGDALRREDDGRWFFVDRLGDTFRWKGENVSTAEVSAVIGQFPGVVEANVYGVLLPNHDGRAGCAAIYIHPEDRKNFDYAGLLRHTRRELPRYAIPIFLRVVEQMTPIHNNKQNKVPLREEGVDPAKTNGKDIILWVPPGGDTYESFSIESWERINGGMARL